VTQAEARSRISIFCDATVEPVLGSEILDLLTTLAKEVDIFGVLPSDTSWTETYNVNYAAAQGWLIKASRLANRYLFMSGGKMFSRNQYYEHCMKQYRAYLMKAGIRATRLGKSPLGLSHVPTNADSW